MGSGSKTTYETKTLDPPKPIPSHSAADALPDRATAAQQSRVDTSSLLTPEEEQARNANLIG